MGETSGCFASVARGKPADASLFVPWGRTEDASLFLHGRGEQEGRDVLNVMPEASLYPFSLDGRRG